MGFGTPPYILTKADIDAVLGYDVDAHASRHASGQPDVVTPAAIAAVAKTGDETIEGVKSFDSVPMVKTTSGLYVPVWASGRGGPHWDNSNWLPADMLDTEVLDSGAVTWDDTYVRCSTGATIDSRCYVWKDTYGVKSNDTWDNDRYWAVNAAFLADADAFLKIVCGRIMNCLTAANTARHVGFQSEDDHLYASAGDGSGGQTKVDLGTFSATLYAKFECMLVAGVRCEFYWDDVLVATITTNLPSGTTYASRVFQMSAGNPGAAANKRITLYEVHFDQKE